MDFNIALKQPDLGYMDVPPDPLDVDKAKEVFTPYRAKIADMLDIAKEYRVSDQKSLADAIAKASDAKKISKRIEDERKRVVEDPNRFVKHINNFCKGFTSSLQEIESILKRKVTQYQVRLEMDRREQEQKARDAAAKLQAELNEEAKAKNIEPVQVAPVEIAPVATVTRTEEGASAHIRKEWVGEIEDAVKVPREFCVPDMRLIREAVKAGKREIQGVKIYEKSTTVIRG